ncbi:hypothetical protein GF406_01225 [candidate division KSB1 bacterium]|nr:hypothetical protein [candidate division KSB1 bacterium]
MGLLLFRVESMAAILAMTGTDQTDQEESMKRLFKRILKGIFIGIIAVTALLLVLIILSVRPVDRKPAQQQKYGQNNVQTVEKENVLSLSRPSGPLLAGTGKAGITPLPGTPLAGYGDRKGAPSTGVHDSLFVQTLFLQNRSAKVFMITADILLIYPELARQIESRLLTEHDIRADQIYFTATHSHSAAGGWGEGWLETQFAGEYDARVTSMIIDSTVMAVQRSLVAPRPVIYEHGQVSLPQYCRNRLVKGGPVDPALYYIAFWHNRAPFALFATYSAHATTLSGRNMEFSGDYPGYFTRRIEKEWGGTALFAASTLGSTSPKGEGKGFERAEFVGEGLADSLLVVLDQRDSTLHSLYHAGGPEMKEVNLIAQRMILQNPSMQVRLSDNIRLAPWLAEKILGSHEPTYLSVLRLDSLLLIGSPAEFSGELGLKVKRAGLENGWQAQVTSFNGCYMGYVTPSKYAEQPGYETRIMSWFGPYWGDHLCDLMISIVTAAPPSGSHTLSAAALSGP